MKATMYESREQLKKLLEQRVAEIEKELVSYRHKAEALSDQAKAEAKAKAAKIEKQLADAKARLGELEDAGAEAWSRTREGAVEAWKVMKQSMDEAAAELK
ncbi:MAG: hypothetical protein R3F30_15430 [Planctomycetota bacterium]